MILIILTARIAVRMCIVRLFVIPSESLFVMSMGWLYFAA